MQPLVSVIINCFNGERFLKKAINSVLKQSYKNIELIFWDNISNDKSSIILKKIKDKRIKYFKSKKFTNLYEARNLALAKAKGDYISFLDTDDWWHKDIIKKQLQKFKKNNDLSIVYTNCYFYNNYTKKKKLFISSFLPEGKITQNLLDNYCVGFLTVLIKKNIFLKDKFNKRYNIIGDFDFILRVSKKYNFGSIQEPLAFYRHHQNNFSLKNLKMYKIEIKYWLAKNALIFKKKGYSINKQILLLVKLNIKHLLAYITN